MTFAWIVVVAIGIALIAVVFRSQLSEAILRINQAWQSPGAPPTPSRPEFRRVRVIGEGSTPIPVTRITATAASIKSNGHLKGRLQVAAQAPCWITGRMRAECPCEECRRARQQ
jgi:hypothetical protein